MDIIGRLNAAKADAAFLAKLEEFGHAPTLPAPVPVTEEQLRAAEERFGFPLPRLLRRFYGEVANGGWGPGYGGLFSLPVDAGEALAGTVRLDSAEDRLLTLCDWGCGITSLAWCAHPEAPVILEEPSAPDEVYEDPAFEGWQSGLDGHGFRRRESVDTGALTGEGDEDEEEDLGELRWVGFAALEDLFERWLEDPAAAFFEQYPPMMRP